MLLPPYAAIACVRGTPGLSFHLKAARLGISALFRSRLRFGEAYALAFHPMDSVRYLEFGALWMFLVSGDRPVRRYLDVSSPRLFPLAILEESGRAVGDLVNPDRKDLALTRSLASAFGLSDRCRFHETVVDDIGLPDATFDLVTSVSAIEHIPGGGDRRAVEKLWGLLGPGGRLLLSVPCAREAFEEYLDRDEYGILAPGDDGFVFGWTCYDAAMIERTIFRVAGKPARHAIYGETKPGLFFRNRSEKISNPNYPFWREAYMMATDYRRYGSIDELPGIGVIAMEFIKS